MHVGDVEVVQQSPVAGQGPAGHQDAAVGEDALLHIAGQSGHGLFVQEQAELVLIAVVDG